jgi:phage terminase large subunit-like protein
VLNQHIANAVQRSTRRGWRIDKPAEGVKIHGAIALVMAVDCSQHVEPAVVFHGFL